MPESTAPSPSPIAVAPALGTWAIAWIVGAIVVTPIAIVAAGGTVGDDLSIPQLAVAMAGVWTVFAVALVLASRRFGSGDPLADLGVRVRPVDLVGIPLGVVAQFALIPLYAPLRAIWPETFDQAEIEQRAQDLADRAGGFDTVLLVVIVVIGAPLVEELVYRGLVQRSLSAAAGRWTALVAASLLFALIHFSPVEYPGLFLAGLFFGAAVTVSGRLGPAFVTHAAFNATGLAIVLS